MKHLDRLIRWAKRAGSKTEASHPEDGFLSYHAETHALGLGIGAGWAALLLNEASLLGIVYGAAVHGRVAQSGHGRRRVWMDVVQEPHYAIGGIVVGGLLALGARAVLTVV